MKHLFRTNIISKYRTFLWKANNTCKYFSEHNKFLLNTPEDDIEDKLKGVKRITLVASLLNSLSENDKIVHSVFRDLESALPMLENFLRVGCQKTEEEDLTAIKVSLKLYKCLFAFNDIS